VRVSQTLRSSYLSHVIVATVYQRPACRCYVRQMTLIIHITGVTWQHPTLIIAIDVSRKVPLEYWHLHHSHCRNTLIYAHTTSRTLPTCDISLGSLIVAMVEARDFVESLEPYPGTTEHPSRTRLSFR